MSSDPNIGVQPRGAQPLPLFVRALGASSQSGPVAGASRAEGRCRRPNEGDGEEERSWGGQTSQTLKNDVTAAGGNRHGEGKGQAPFGVSL